MHVAANMYGNLQFLCSSGRFSFRRAIAQLETLNAARFDTPSILMKLARTKAAEPKAGHALSARLTHARRPTAS